VLTRKDDFAGMISLLMRKHGRTVGFIKPTFDGFTAEQLCGVERDIALRLFPTFA
jgi:hypothetical protein